MEEKLLEDKLSIFAPQTHIDLHWRDVSYSIKGKQILKGLNGFAQSSCLNAIMGASGAGKTTFLNYLSCRLSKSKFNSIEGQIFANNQPCTSELLSKTAAYVMQDDILMDTLTPRGKTILLNLLFKHVNHFYYLFFLFLEETLLFAAKLKLNIPESERMKRVEEMLKALKLEKCADTLVLD